MRTIPEKMKVEMESMWAEVRNERDKMFEAYLNKKNGFTLVGLWYEPKTGKFHTSATATSNGDISIISMFNSITLLNGAYKKSKDAINIRKGLKLEIYEQLITVG